jgi:hypothetical protein
MFQEIDDLFIRHDITDLRKRIATARKKLEELPATAPTWMARKKLKAKRLYLKDEIVHVRHLIDIAESALEVSNAS